MSKRELSPREEEIIELCVEGLTNDAIASRMGLGVGTVNTYWLRIRLKVGGLGRTDTVVRVIKERAERALREANVERQELSKIMARKDHGVLELRAAMALLQMAMDKIKSTVWATDLDLSIRILANGELPATHFGVKWEVGRTVYEVFKTKDPDDLGVAAHLGALKGVEKEVRLSGEFASMLLHVIPLADEAGEVVGCISVLNSVGE